jgi:acyl-coenzyme A synthetase/AMP-(fatty) acid ligase
VFFHTSGTTKSPKVIQHKRSQFATFAAMSQTTFELDRPTRFLSFLPPFTSAFWHIVIPSFYQTGFELHLSSRDRVIQDLSSTKFDVTAMVSNFTDFFRSSKQSFDFSAFRLMLIGGAPVVNRHAEFLFEHGATMCAHAYGTTECGSPLLARKFTQDDQHYDHIDLVPTTNGVELKLVDNELWVKSPSLCENYQSFSHEGSWWRTGDLWQQDQGLIKFIGRNDDVVKVNGYPANLLEIEHWWEAHADLGECTAKPRSIGGNDYIELLYTKEFNSIEKENLKARAKELFPPCNVPVKFTQIDLIPRTSLGKKQRYLVK